MQDTNWYTEEKQLIKLIEMDASAPYEVDQSIIGLNKITGKFGIMFASGCSCWDGDAQIEYADDLDSLEILYNKQADGDVYKYYLSLKGSKELFNKARENFREMCLKYFGDKNA